MKFKKLGRILCAVAIAGTVMALPFVSGCNTDHPEAEITISYNGSDYVLKYKMYRNMYPQTVQHFIELADNGFYNGMIVHNYQSSYWYTGGYNYVVEEEDVPSYEDAIAGDDNDRLDFMEAASKEYEYSVLADPDNGKITPSVYEDIIDGKYIKPLNTLIGEFSNNQHKIDNGALTNAFGSLSMYYTAKKAGSVENQMVYLDKTGSDFGVKGSYSYNSATSIFRIQTGTSTSSSSSYCVFATLKNTDVLTNLRSDISSNGMTTKSVTLYVDNYDRYLGANVNSESFTMTSVPLIIKSVKITKY